MGKVKGSIFSDRASLILRAMLLNPERKWTVRSFEREFDIGRSRAAQVLYTLRQEGIVRGVSAGRLAYSQLRDKDKLIQEWLNFYRFDFNEAHLYYSEHADVIKEIKNYLQSKGWQDKYALTLHTGANLITSYVRLPTVYCYLDSDIFDKMSLEIRQALDIKELKIGGNIYFIKPYYKKSVFFEKRIIRGFPVVSDLQLYLDLFHFPQRGRQHAEHLLKVLKDKGDTFA